MYIITFIRTLYVLDPKTQTIDTHIFKKNMYSPYKGT